MKRIPFLLAVFVGCQCFSSSSFSGQSAEKKTVNNQCANAATVRHQHQGKTLTILAPNPPVMGEPVARHAKEFADLTGAIVKVKHVPFEELYESVMLPFLSGKHQYDVLFYGSLWIADVAPFLMPLPKYVLESPHMQEVTETYRYISTWQGQLVQFPIDGDRHYFKYRRSPFNNSEYQARYLKKMGTPLVIPTTWQQYSQVASFFNGWDWDSDRKLEYGAAEVTSTDDIVVFSTLLHRAASFAKHPAVNGGFFFDLKTMEPLVNNPGWVRALEHLVDTIRFTPPGGGSFDIAKELVSFGDGQALFSNSWDDATVRAAEAKSPIRDDLGFSVLGSSRVWNREANRWDEFEEPNRIPYVAWGWTSGVSASTPEPELAFEFLCFFKNHENHIKDLSLGHTGVNPHRHRDFDANFYISRMGWSKRQATQYVKTLKSIDQAKHKILDLRVPGANLFMESMVRGIALAKAGKVTAQQALDDVAMEWREIMAEIGIDIIREAYADVVAVEDGEANKLPQSFK